jgi:hypothetical protein
VSLGGQLPSAAAALERLVRGEPWLLGVLAAARACGAPDCWVGGGVLRDLVWDQLHGRFDPAAAARSSTVTIDPRPTIGSCEMRRVRITKQHRTADARGGSRCCPWTLGTLT